MSSGIYEIRNMVNGHRYIGSAVNTSGRWNTHLWHFRRGTHHSPYLQAAFNKYGEENFIFTVLYECQPEELIRCEQEELDILKPEYNMCSTAGSRIGIKASEETREKQRLASPHKKLSEEHKKKIIMAHVGKKLSEETKSKISKAHLGKPLSESHKHTLSVVLTGRVVSEETKEKMRVALNGRTIRPPDYITSDETKRKIGAANKIALTGRINGPCPEETRRKISEAKKGKPLTEEHKMALRNAYNKKVLEKKCQ